VTFPVMLDAFGVALHPHAVFEALGYFVGFRVYLWQRRRQGDAISSHTRWSVIAAAALGGAIGSKLLYLFEDPAIWTRRRPIRRCSSPASRSSAGCWAGSSGSR
jgi:phosphatidylglycerol:prolipoprotein diacylglycerol transferase